MPYGTDGTFEPAAMSANSHSIPLELLSELGQATTAYHEAPPDRMEYARLEYEAVLRRFNSLQFPGTVDQVDL
jgi:hypothetical protein